MYTAQDFQQAIAEYIDFNVELQNNIGMVGGILKVFGFGSNAEKDPGHEKFFNEMNQAMKEVSDSQPDSETAGQIIDVVFESKYKYAGKGLAETLFPAIEYTAIGLIPYLSQEKAAEVYAFYQKENPRRKRFPVQNKIVEALRLRAGVSEKTRFH